MGNAEKAPLTVKEAKKILAQACTVMEVAWGASNCELLSDLVEQVGRAVFREMIQPHVDRIVKLSENQLDLQRKLAEDYIDSKTGKETKPSPVPKDWAALPRQVNQPKTEWCCDRLKEAVGKTAFSPTAVTWIATGGETSYAMHFCCFCGKARP